MVNLPVLPGSIKEAHKALAADKPSMESLHGGHSGILHHLGECHIEYYVPKCDPERDSCVHRQRNSWTLPFDIDVVAINVHQHKAAINFTSWAGPSQTRLCTNVPTYNVSSGRIREISNCRVEGKGDSPLAGPVSIKKGELLTAESVVAQDAKPHFGMMGYIVLMAVRGDVPPRLTDL